MKDAAVINFVNKHEYISIIDENWGTFYVKHPEVHVSSMEDSSFEIRGIILANSSVYKGVHEIVIGGSLGINNIQQFSKITKDEFNRVLNQYIKEANG